METRKIPFGLAEYVTLASMLMVAGLVAAAVAGGWTIALVPGLAYLLAAGASYALYRLYAAEKAQGLEQVAITTRRGEQLITPVDSFGEKASETAIFRVIDTHGVCTVGRAKGDLLTVDPAGSITPQVCQHAEAVLRMAAAANGEPEIKEWCCPIYDHLLVFRRERVAA